MIQKISIAVVALIAIAGLVLPMASEKITETLGSTTQGSWVVQGGLTYGAGCTTLTDANGGTYTMTQDELLGASCFEFAAGGAGQAAIALTFPATSTMTKLIPREGDCREWKYDSTALAAGTTTTMTAGTGHNIIAYTTNDDVIDGTEYAQITMCRQSDGDVNTFVTEMLNAD